MRPQPPWYGYSLGDWLPQWDEAAKRAALGRYLENGLISAKQKRKGLKPETKFRPDTDGLKGGKALLREHAMAVAEELSFTYFPNNYRWSHGLLIGLNMAPWGGAEIGEVNRVGLRLKDNVGDDDAWFREWTREARASRTAGRERIAAGHTTSGAQYLQRASAYYHVGERFLQPKSKDGLDAYRRGVDCFRDAAKYIKRPRIEARGNSLRRRRACRRFTCTPNGRTHRARCRRWCSSTASISPRKFNTSRASPISSRAASPA